MDLLREILSDPERDRIPGLAPVVSFREDDEPIVPGCVGYVPGV